MTDLEPEPGPSRSTFPALLSMSSGAVAGVPTAVLADSLSLGVILALGLAGGVAIAHLVIAG